MNQTTTDPVTGAEIVISTSYQPCRYEDRAQWENLSSEELYYHKSDTVSVVILYLFMRKRQIPINSVSKVQRYGISATSICRKEPEKMQVPGKLQDRSPVVIRGFCRNGNIHTLTIGKSVKGVGVYAFYGCTGMSSISLGNGLNIIGDYAFANCLTMTSVNLDRISNLTTISDYAFANCQSMENLRFLLM